VPKAVRAAEAIKANPAKSDGAIAADIGVNRSTVTRARQTTSADAPVERTGLDGKSRRVPTRPPPSPVSDPPAAGIANSTFEAKNVEAEAAEPTVEEAEAEVRRLKAERAALKDKINANGSTAGTSEQSTRVLAEFLAACEAFLPKMHDDDLQDAIDHFAEVVEVAAGDLMPDLNRLRFDLKIAKAEVAALKRKLAGKLPPRESRAAAWARLAEEAVGCIEELISYQSEFESAKEEQPESLQRGPFAEKCEEVCMIDLGSALQILQEAESSDLPLGFGRD
jgi:hypothetical protein